MATMVNMSAVNRHIWSKFGEQTESLPKTQFNVNRSCIVIKVENKLNRNICSFFYWGPTFEALSI